MVVAACAPILDWGKNGLRPSFGLAAMTKTDCGVSASTGAVAALVTAPAEPSGGWAGAAHVRLVEQSGDRTSPRVNFKSD